MSKVLEELKYLETHEWIREEDDGTYTVGISDYAQDALGDIVYVNLPEAGEEIQEGDSFAEVESVKSVSDVYSPASGEILEVNENLMDEPERINQDPYGAWIIRIGNAELSDKLMNSTEYEEFLENEV